MPSRAVRGEDCGQLKKPTSKVALARDSQHLQDSAIGALGKIIGACIEESGA